jgi:hypothetical protein
MNNPIVEAKKLSTPMFIVFVLSKVVLGIGIGVLLYAYLAPYGWWFLGVGLIFSLICLGLILKDVGE